MNRPNNNNAPVFIQDVNGNIWNPKEWDKNCKANAIAVITPNHNFTIALHDCEDEFAMTEYNGGDELSETMRTVIARTEAEQDYDGAGNSILIDEVQDDSRYASAACYEFEFPDHKTRGYLPSLGELSIMYCNLAAINKALTICGGDRILPLYYWSSTFGSKIGSHGCCFWRMGFHDGYTYKGDAICLGQVRPCASLNNVSFP